MAHHVVLDLDAVAAVHVAGVRAMSSALPQLLRLMSEIISGVARPSSMQAADPERRLQAERDLGLHVGELLLNSWVSASGRPNCLRSRLYWRARIQQSSAAPMTPQAMP